MHGNSTEELAQQSHVQQRVTKLEHERKIVLERIYNAGWDYDEKDSSRLRWLDIAIGTAKGEELIFTHQLSIY